MKIVEKKLDEIKPYENNPRFNDDAVQYVANSIKEFGFKVPIVIDKDNTIVAGHTRYKASLLLGLDKVPCVVADDLNEEQVKAFRLADNKVGEMANWDYMLLDEELADLDIDMSEFGFDENDIIEDEENKEIIEDDIPETPKEPKSKLGDIYILGKHRLMCGDSTSEEDVAKLMNGVKADMTFTDPPYGIKAVQGSKIGGDKSFGKVGGENIVKSNTYSTIIGDDTTDTARLNYEIVKELSNNQIIFGGNYFTDFLKPSKCWCVWDKQNTGNFADVELAWTSFDKGAKIYHYLWNGLVREGTRDLELNKRVHPTQKPVGMIINILKDFTEENNSIIDCFGGSGSTLIACEQLNRKCYMMELDPHYIDVIIQRWENLTGQKATKLN